MNYIIGHINFCIFSKRGVAAYNSTFAGIEIKSENQSGNFIGRSEAWPILWKGLYLLSVVMGTLLVGVPSSHSQTTNTVDSNKNWLGYMLWYENSGGSAGAYVGGSVWTPADLRAGFQGTNTLNLASCTNVWDSTNTFWVKSNGTGAKWMEANFYVETLAFGGQTVAFAGNCLSNQLTYPYTSVAFIKEFAPGYAFVGMTTASLVAGGSFSVTRPIGVGNICQYGFVTSGPDSNPTNIVSSRKVVIAVENPTTSVTELGGQALVEGENARLTVAAQGPPPLTYQWTYSSQTATNTLTNGGRIFGAATNSLSISNMTLADAGLYSVTVSSASGSVTTMASLVVVPFSKAATNLLIDSDFEETSFPYDPKAGWFPFNGAVKASTNNTYYLSSTQVSVVDGTHCVQIYSAGPGSYNGIYQDRPASPGAVYTADAWFLTPTDDPISGSNVCYLEVQFRSAADVPLLQYKSLEVTGNSPAATWINLVPTNVFAGDLATSLGSSPPYMVAPAGTAKVRYQVTYHAVDAAGSVYVDALNMRLRESVVSASVSGNDVQLSFSTLFGPTFRVLYKTNLTDVTWQVLSSIPGDGTVKTILDPISSGRRFYSVNTQ